MATELRGLRASEMEAHAELVHASYYEYVVSGERNFLADPHWWLKSAQADPYYEPEQTRVMVIDGQLVASVTNYLRQMHCDGRFGKASCIGSVCTHPDFRKRGLVRQVLAESIEWMEREGFNWSLLYGKEQVYGGSGWTILSSWNLASDLLVSDGFGEGLTQREADPERDLSTLVSLYEAFTANLTGPIARNEAYWRDRVLAGRFGRPGPKYMLIEREGKPVAYYNGGDGSISELAWIEQPHDVLAFLLRQWPAQKVSLPLGTTELIQALREITTVPGYEPWQEHPGRVELVEAYKGLWRYIGPGEGQFPGITDTESLKRFMREHDYCFFGADSF